MKIDLNELESLARAATPGPWLHRHDPGNPAGCQHGIKLPGELGAWIADCIDSADRSMDGGVAGERNAAFVAAANPAAVLELIALARQAPPAVPAQTGMSRPATIPHGWCIKQISEGRIAVEKEGIGGYAAESEADSIASSILHALAADMIAAQPVQQPAPVATVDTPELGRLLALLEDANATGSANYQSKTWLDVIAHIDAHTASAVEQEHYRVQGECEDRIGNLIADLNDARAALAAPVAAPVAMPAANVQPFQQRVQPWMMACFGAEISADTKERNHRFFEESTELVQAQGMTASEAHQLVDYVYGRPVGEPAQEVGGVMVTLAALCLANGLDMHQAAEVELARIWAKVESIRAKQAAKPKHSPLPAPPNAEAPIEAALAAFCDQEGYPSDGPMDGVLRKAFAAGASFAFDWKGGA